MVAYFLKFLADNSFFVKEVSESDQYLLVFCNLSCTLIIIYHLLNPYHSLVQYYPHFAGYETETLKGSVAWPVLQN